MKSRKMLVVALMLVLAVALSGCSWNKPVEEHEIGLKLKGGTEIVAVLPAGRHSAMGWFDEIKTVSVSALTVQWQDPDLVTWDKQQIGFSVQATFARDRNADEIKKMWQDYNAETVSDEALMAQVLGRIPRVAKAVTTQFTLDQMLGIDEEGVVNEQLGREIVTQKIEDYLARELAEIHCVLLDVGINNIAPDQNYMALLARKATAQVSVEVAREEKELADVQVLTEKAQTEVELEKARRARLVAQENAKVFETNPGWLRLQIWEAAKEVFAGDNVWFIDPNTDLTLLFTGEGDMAPIPLTTP